MPITEVVKAIGTFERRLQPENADDLPQPTKVVRKDGVEVEAQLTRIYCDDASQGDGTFYFDRDVRPQDHHVKKYFLFGREIETITFL